MSRRRAAGQLAVAREEASPAGPETPGSRSRASGTVRGVVATSQILAIRVKRASTVLV